MLQGFSLGNYLLLVDYTGRLFREGKAAISAELAGILERLGTTAESWQARLEKLKAGRLLGRFFAASRARLRETATRLRLHHLANLGGCASAIIRSEAQIPFPNSAPLRAANQPAPSVMSRNDPVPSAVHLSLAVRVRPAGRASDAAMPSPPASPTRLAWLSRGRDVCPVLLSEENPVTGRWDSQDPLGFMAGQDDLYGYVADDPLNLVDPTGLDASDYIPLVGPLWGLWDAQPIWSRETRRSVDLDAQLAELQRQRRDSGQDGPVEGHELQGYEPNGQGGQLNSGSQSRYFGGSTGNAAQSAGNMLTLGATATLEELGKQAILRGIKLSDPQSCAFRDSARRVWKARAGLKAGKLGLEVHHRIPLEWSHLFPRLNPNRIASLVGVKPGIHDRITAMWNTWRTGLGGRTPSAAEVMQKALEIDRLFGTDMTFLPP